MLLNLVGVRARQWRSPLMSVLVLGLLSACAEDPETKTASREPGSFQMTVQKNGNGTVTSTPAGINCGSDCNESYSEDTNVTLVAAPDMGYSFGGWSGACTGTGNCVLSMSQARNVTATFIENPVPRTLTVVADANGRVTSSPAGINCGNGSTTCTAEFDNNTLVTLTAQPATGYMLNAWGDACTGNTGCSFRMTADARVTASFVVMPATVDLTTSVTVGSGTITSNPAGINCGTDCTEAYATGTTVALSATPASGFLLSSWGGACSGSSTCSVEMSVARNVTAAFAMSRTLNVSVTGTGTVTSNPTGINCGADCTQNYPDGTSVTLTATPGANFTFTGWGGACSGTGNCVVSMTAQRDVTATFTAQTSSFALTVVVAGSGTVTSNPAGINCGSDCTESYTQGTSVTLTAAPSSGYTFSGWSNACTGNGSCVVAMTAARNVTATFSSTGTGSFTRVRVSGFGYVAADDNSLSCGSVPTAAPAGVVSNKCTARYTSGSKTFTATPYNASFVFKEWRGACTGTTNTCTLDVSTAKNFQAVFTSVNTTTDVCQALGLKSDLAVYRLDNHFPTLAIGESFTDPKFGTTIRRLTNVRNDGRSGGHRVLKTVYSTISALNADETYFFLYRADGSGASRHELFNARTYQFIRPLVLPNGPVDLEQIYWDTHDPDILYYASRTQNRLYKYSVSNDTSTVVRDFNDVCVGKELHGGSDPMFNSWDSKRFGFACVPGTSGNPGKLFAYDQSTNTVGTSGVSTYNYGGPQMSPSGTYLYMNENNDSQTGQAASVRNFNMGIERMLDLASGNEHGALSMLANGDDTWNAVEFDDAPRGGTLVQHNMRTGARRVIVGQSTGYPYAPSGTHHGGTAFYRSGLVAVSIKDDSAGDSLLDTEMLYVDTDPETNPANKVCRVGHHRTTADTYWAEPHPSISPSGTRIMFSSSWGTVEPDYYVDVYIIELPGFRQ